MTKKDYSVMAGIMELPSGKCFEVGSHEWRDWLNSSDAESFRFECDFGVKGYRARKEEIKARSGSFWYAYKRIEGKLRKRYLGKSEELSLERLESVAYDLAKPVEARSEIELPNKSVDNHLTEAYEQLKVGAVERENCYNQLLEQKIRLEKRVQELETQLNELHNTLGNQDELRELKHRCIHLENENNRLTRLGQDYSQATVSKLSQKYTKALNDIQHWKEASESYQRQAAKLRTEVDELHNTLGNNLSVNLDGVKRYKLHGREVVRVDDLN
jgi:chromosome segregation ATPase